MIALAAGLGLALLVVIVASLLFAYRRWSRADCGIRDARRVLLVTAHPDDEAMFFSPTILGLVAGGADVHLLCLSSGDFRAQGSVRKAELRAAAEVLGIPSAHVVVVEHSKLPDDPAKLWPRSVVAEVVLGWAERLGASTIVTFDGGGVSGHRNHIALYRGIQSLYSSGRLPAETSVFVLQSVWLGRKYAGLLDIPASINFSSFVYVSGPRGAWRAVRAMREGHRSQMLWFRYLYLLFSRYILVNTLKRIPMDPKFYSPSPTKSAASSRPSTDAASPQRRPLARAKEAH